MPDPPIIEEDSGIIVPEDAPTAGAAAHPGAWARIKEHKVLQWGLAYVGAALAIAHGQELMASAFDWPHSVGRLVMALLVLGLPLVLALAWYHGHRGLRYIGAGEMTVIALLLVIIAAGFVVLVREPQSGPAHAVAAADARPAAAVPSDAPAAPVTPTKPRLAIMPFENLSPDPNNAFFTDGLHEEILTALANSAPGLEVISRTTMMSFRGRPVTVQEVAKALGATHVLEGSVRRDGQDVRLTLQLIDARNDDHLWAQNYDRKLVKAMTLQSAVAAEVAAQLSAKLTGTAQSAGAPTTDPEAYDLYLKARLAMQLLNPSVPVEPYRAVEALLTQAIERDPSFAVAYAARSDLRFGLFTQNFARQDALTAARADLDTAERLRPNDPAWLIAEARWAVLDEQYAHALELVMAAEAAGVAEATTVTAKSQIKMAMNQFREGFALMQRAAVLDPENAGLGGGVAISLAVAREPAASMRSFRALTERECLHLHPSCRAPWTSSATASMAITRRSRACVWPIRWLSARS